MPTERTLAELVSIYWRTELAAKRTRSAAAAPTKGRLTMPCPTCDHTLQAVGEVPAVGGRPAFWCPRCRTLCHGNDCEAPKLVERCREFEKSLIAAGMMTDVQPWRTLGIAESIHKPEERTGS